MLRRHFLIFEFYLQQAYLKSSAQNDAGKWVSTVWGICLTDLCISLPLNTMLVTGKLISISFYYIF